MVKTTSVKKRVNEGVRVLTAIYGTRKVWGIGPKAIENEDVPADAIFNRLGIDYATLTADVDAEGVTKVKRTAAGYNDVSEVDGSALGFYPAGHTNYAAELQELKDAWITRLREMRAKSIGSTSRRQFDATLFSSTADVQPNANGGFVPATTSTASRSRAYAGC